MRREIETLEGFDAQIRTEGSLAGCLAQSLDLRGRADVLARVPVHNAFFLGCRLKHRSALDLAARGAAVFPRLPQVPFDAYRPALYTAPELYADLAAGYTATPDARIYNWALRERSSLLDATLAQALHDHFVSDALLDVGHRTITPSARSASFTSPTVRAPVWNTLAASTASASPG